MVGIVIAQAAISGTNFQNIRVRKASSFQNIRVPKASSFQNIRVPKASSFQNTGQERLIRTRLIRSST